MRIYAAGWALQSPALNFFKRFLVLNAIQLSGIVYPRQIPDDLDGIPVLDFETARSELHVGDVVLECHRPGVDDQRMGTALSEFFATLRIQTVGVAAFISSLIEQDQGDLLRFPVAGVTSTHLRGLRDEPLPRLIEDGFVDLRSHQVATRLDAIARSCDWDQMLAFDQDQTPEEELHVVVAELHAYGMLQRVHVLDTPLPFLEALLALKVQAPESELVVELAAAAAQALGPQLEFYRRSLGCLQVAEASAGVTYLSGSADAIARVMRPGHMSAPAVFFMRRSILDIGTIRRASGAQPYRIMLRQPDTSPGNLIAALLN
ncbi:hypothetical protein KHF85_09785 [Xanthomonas translucens pv. graminis]|uniref:hypothetical protein n=1 Tax=Xanthomonas graminis TaxID=3390026 RepID=UPI00254080DF|nr:hypothetical protein [Xanthomonas translucens]WIH06646.1 hypothetical protein KHF85_09785 [Xanthomonas translucens pv. graminis]